ncbi:TonB-dependent siderophore receptor [Nodosilinea sp. LEGE 06152]|uniref:TonB-dependent siderophore receptor n=1 Tax=Nodosilinea sp. LEGE 06152 TaxID=2777966 RepID=UPI001882E05D|nr:TonB-dependent siderophore receptor [Nodosilinea sp. LEGE 06152]MBE9157004.1 TonB-dependent siderophore receptor [Nodosilinea sp. LEGE 06152]
MGVRLQRLVWLAGWLALVPTAAQAETALSLGNIAQPGGQAVDLELAQAATQITGVRIEPEGEGLRLVLDANGALGEPTTSVVGSALVAEIANAVLTLPEGESFEQFGPAEGIALVSVTNEPGNRVRVAITGSDGPPAVTVSSRTAGLVLGIAPGLGLASGGDEAIRIGVTGEGDEGYAPRNSSTATRTDTPLRDTPRTIQIIPEQVLEDQGITRVTDAVRNVSGVVQDGGFGSTTDQLNIRGFFTDGIFVDGFRGNGSGFAETANVERIEVLRGPASVLFGNTEPGGIVNLVTKQPLDEPFYGLEFQAGSYGFIRPTVDLTGPLNTDRTTLYRFNGAYERANGFRAFDQTITRYFAAPSLAFRLGDATTLNLDFTYRSDERPFDRGLLAIGRGVVDTPLSRIFGEPDDVSRVQEYGAGYRLEHEFSDSWQVRNQFRLLSTDTFDYRAEPLALDEGTGILPRNFRSNDDRSEVYSLQTDVLGNFFTGSVEHNLLIGLDLRRQTSGGTQRRLPGGLTPSIDIFNPVYNVVERPALSALTNEVRNNSDRTNALGFFVQDQVQILDNLIVVAGGRFDVVSQNSRNNQTGENSGQDVTAFTPTVGVVYQPVEPISLYANFARSFQPNASTDANNNFLPPERGTQYEVGVQAAITDRLTASLAAYNITKTNLATTDPDNPDFSIPIAEQRSRGIDLNLAGEILPGWNVIASYGYIDAAYTAEYFGLPPGSRVQNVPNHTASLWSTYEIQSGDLQGLGFGAGIFYVGDRAGDFEDTFDLPSYLRTDAAVFYRRNNWRAAINVQNLFDVRYFSSNNFGRVAIEPGEPLSIVGSLSVEF